MEQEPLRWNELSPEEQHKAGELLGQNILGLRLGLPQQDRLTAVREACQAAGHPLLESLNRLESLRTELESASGRNYVELMTQVDLLMAPLAPYQALDFGHLIRWLVISGRDDPKTMLQLAPNLGYQNGSLFDKRYSLAVFTPDWAHPIVEVCQDPVSSADLKPVWPMVYQLLEDGILVPAGAQVPSGSSWDSYNAEILNAMCAMQLTAPRDRIAQLLRQAWPVEPIFRHPVAAEADLAEALQGQIREIPLVGKDRNFLVCDSQRRIDGLAIGGKLSARIQSLLDGWFRFRAYWVYRDDLALTAILDQILPTGAKMPLAQFLGTAQQWLKSGFSPPFTERLPFDIQYDRAEQIIHLVEDEPNPNLENWLRNKKLVSSVDLMLGGTTAELEEGRGQILLSEAHSGSEGLPATITFPKTHPDWSLQGYASSIFGDNTLILQPTDLTKQSEGILAQLQDLALVVRDPECSWAQERSIPLKRLNIVRNQSGATIVDEQTRQEYQLVSSPWCIGDIRLVSFSPSEISQWLAKNVSNPPAYSHPKIRVQPEVRLGDLVLARRMVLLPADHLAGHLDALRLELALPRFCFFNTGSKPMLVDFESDISREVLLAELAKAEEVSLSPMQPQPDQLWLDGYCSELRFIASWQGEAFSGK